MKAVRLHQYGDADQLVYEDAPDPAPGPGEVVVDVKAAGVNPMDWKLRSGAYQAFWQLPMPVTLGADVAGTVAAVGPDVTGLEIGDRVMVMTQMGGYAEKAKASAAGVAKVPDGLDFTSAAALPLPGLTALAEVSALQVKAGDKVLVTGALGAIGRVVIHLLQKAGATPVAGVRARQKDDAAVLGVQVVALDDAAELAAAGPFDGVADNVGGEVAAATYSHVRKGGRFAAAVGAPANATDDAEVINVQVTGGAADVRAIAEAALAGAVTIPVTTMPLADAAKAHKLAEAGGAGRIILTP
ncbi:MAG: NADP-dependent oxidoreductase [Bauldia sp.]|nr:NADP-dependent oxidoreductase [Bauldia sp.]